MNLYNPTLDVIEDMFNGFSYIIGPDQTKSVSDDAGKHLVRRMGMYGLVSLDYGVKEEAKFGSLKEFTKTKKKEGLASYKAFLDQCLMQEQMFPREVQHKNGGEVELGTTRVPFFKNKVKEVEALLKKEEDGVKEIKEEVKKETSFALKRRGRPARNVKVETYVNKGTIANESASVSG